MTTFTSISNPSVAVGGIPSSTTVTALRDNPIAIAEGASGAPVLVSGWHPVDKVTVGDGKRGIIYDYTVSGTVSSVITPDFEDGYEYRLFGSIDPSSSATTSFDFYLEDDAAYSTAHTTGSSGSTRDFDLELTTPRFARFNHGARFWTSAGSISTTTAIGTGSGVSQKVLRVRVRFGGSADIVAGWIYLFRRREFATAD